MGSTTDDTFRILIATDNHLGCFEKDPERGNDSFTAFEEILQLAVEQQVDFILLGGDLFHENKPSRQCTVKCMQLLRKYTLGDKPVCFEYISDPAENFKHLKNPMVNFHDPNLNISIPIFSIHGNHDDPSGLGQFCALDLLSTTGLINYFGHTGDLKNVTISPILLEKGASKLALFGLSSIKDERLFRLFKENKVKLMLPKEFQEEWFNLMVLHQNRVKHSMTNYIPEHFLDDCLDLVVWGHEHESIVDTDISNEGGKPKKIIIQPGSSVATSLCAGEASEKNVVLLEVKQGNFKITKIALETVRPFIFDDVCLADHSLDYPIAANQINPVEEFVEKYIRSMIEKAKKLLTGHPRQPTKPLIRLRVEYTDESQMFNTPRFGHRFTDDVANPGDMIKFKKQRQELKKNDVGIDKDAMDAIFDAEIAETKVEDLVEQYFNDLENPYQQLFLLTEKGVGQSVSSFVEKDNKEAISNICKHQIKKTVEYILRQDTLDEENVEDAILSCKIDRLNKNKQQEEEETQQVLANTTNVTRNNEDEDDEELSDFDTEQPKSPPPTRGRGSRGGRVRGSRGTRAASSSSTSATSRKGQLTLAGDGSPISSSKTTRRGTRGRGRASTRIQSSIMDSFSKAKAAANKRKGAQFDSDSDD